MSAEIVQKIYLACAETSGEDIDRSMERAYTTREQAESAAEKMVKEIREQMGLEMIPYIEEIDLVTAVEMNEV